MSGGRPRKPQGGFSRWFERVALSAIMGVVAFVVERRLSKALRRRGEEGAASEEDVQLTVAPEQVDE
jgi:hypothetical protein